MKKGVDDVRSTTQRTLGFLLAVVSVTSLAFVNVAQGSSPEDLIRNGGFETKCTDTEDMWAKNRQNEDEPAHWLPLRYLHVRNLPVQSWDDQVSHSGNQSIRVSVVELDMENPDMDRAWQTLIEATDLVGQSVTLSFFLKTDEIIGNGYAYGAIHCRESMDDWRARDPRMTASSHMYLGADTMHVAGTTEWTQYCVSLTVPEGTSRIFVYLGLHGLGTCWFDDVTLTVDAPCGQEPEQTYSWMHEVVVDPNAPEILPVRRTEKPQLASQMSETKPWAVILYNDAEFPGANPIDVFAGQAQSTENVHILVLEDTLDRAARTWHVTREMEEAVLTCVGEPGEVNMADGRTLSNILAFASRWYPSDRTMVMIYDHGHGWWGACRDETNAAPTEDWQQRDWLTPLEMSEALQAQGGIDALLFTAPCLMAALETAYEVRNGTDLYVASQENSGYVVWQNVIGHIIQKLCASPEISIEALGSFVIEEVLIANEEEEDASPFWNRTISATSTDGLDELAVAVDGFSAELIAVMAESFDQIREAREASQSFGINEMIDVVDFSQQCAALIPQVAESSLLVQRAVYATVIGSLWDSKHPRARGLTLHFPYPDPKYPEESATMSYAETRDTYVNYGLDFLASTHWDEFLDAFFAEMQSRGEATTIP